MHTNNIYLKMCSTACGTHFFFPAENVPIPFYKNIHEICNLHIHLSTFFFHLPSLTFFLNPVITACEFHTLIPLDVLVSVS